MIDCAKIMCQCFVLRTSYSRESKETTQLGASFDNCLDPCSPSHEKLFVVLATKKQARMALYMVSTQSARQIIAVKDAYRDEVCAGNMTLY